MLRLRAWVITHVHGPALQLLHQHKSPSRNKPDKTQTATACDSLNRGVLPGNMPETDGLCRAFASAVLVARKHYIPRLPTARASQAGCVYLAFRSLAISGRTCERARSMEQPPVALGARPAL